MKSQAEPNLAFVPTKALIEELFRRNEQAVLICLNFDRVPVLSMNGDPVTAVGLLNFACHSLLNGKVRPGDQGSIGN